MPTTNTLYQLSTRSEQKEVLVVEPIFILHTPRSKDNNINSESTKGNDPTKRLDKVDDATGRIAYNITNTSIATLEINRDTLLKEGTTKIGQFDTNEIIHNDKSLISLRDFLTCPRVSIESVVVWLLNNFRFGCTHTHINGPMRLLQFAGRVDLRMRSPPFTTSAF